jgi:hypothetical protein
MLRQGKRLFAAAVLPLFAMSFAMSCALLCATPVRAAVPDFGTERVSADAQYAAARVLEIDDARGRPFALVDKRDARIYVFDTAGHLLGASAALLGLAPGDTAIADIAQRSPASLAPGERSTPAGRFESQPGHNDKGEAIVWVDYDASLAIHRLRPAPAQEHRAARLASSTPEDNRISYGCIVVPVAFFEEVVEPAIGRQRGVVYVLPETRPVQSMFDAIDVGLAKR